QFRVWMIGSLLLMAASIGALFVNKAVRGQYMNWTIDFKGGTEIVFAFKDKTTGAFTEVEPGKVREAFKKANEGGVEISSIHFTEPTPQGDVEVHGLKIQTLRFSALTPEQQQAATAAFLEKFKDREI